MRSLLIILLCSLLAINLYGAAFEDIGSVRARGMGDAFESISAGIDSVHYNPAGTAYLAKLQVLTEYGKPAIGFDDESSFNSLHFGVAVPFSRKPYLIWLNYIFKGLTIGNEEKVVQDGAFSFIFHELFVSDFAHQRMFTFNIGKSLNNLFEGANLAAGVNFNIFNTGFEHNADTRAMAMEDDFGGLANSTTGFGIDLGLTYDFSRYIRISFVLANLLEPNISFFKDVDDGDESVNQQIRGGLAWQIGDISFMKNFLASVGLVQISRDSEDPRKPETIYKAGAEFWQWQNRIGFRLGFKTLLNVISSGLSYRHKFDNIHHIVVHYAFNYPLNSANIKNYFSLNYEFDFPDYFFDYRKESEIREENKRIMENYNNGKVIVMYKILPNDNLYNISLIHYGSPGQAELLKKENKIEDGKKLPAEIKVPYNADAFVTYKIQPGDTIESISMKLYNTTGKIEKIKRFNKVPFKKLRKDRILIIPMGKEDKEAYEKYQKEREEREKMKSEEESRRKEEEKKKAVTPKSVVPSTGKAESKTSTPGSEKIHVIVSGDNLFKISNKYYNTKKYWKKIAEYNGIDPNKLRLGMKLKIPDESALK